MKVNTKLIVLLISLCLTSHMVFSDEAEPEEVEVEPEQVEVPLVKQKVN
jgi:hypothetical protein